MPLVIPSRDDIHDDFIADYSAAQPEQSVAELSIPYIIGRAVSGLAWMVISKLIYYARNLLPDTADEATMARFAGVWNFPRNGPKGSSGTQALQVSGTPGAAITYLAQLTHADGTVYQVATNGAVVGIGGTGTVDLIAVSTGKATNKVAGEALSFSPTTPPGVNNAAVLVAKLTGGLDQEELEAFRARFLAHIGDPPEGGAIHDYVEWALRQAGVATAYVWAHRRGGGTIDVAVLADGTGSRRIAADSVIAAVDDYIEDARPGNVRDFEVLTTVPVTQDVQLTIDIDDAYRWDWDDVGVGYTITVFDSVAKTITVPTAPATVVAGVRLTVNGEEAQVTNRAGNVLTLIFDTDHDGSPVSWFTFGISTGVDQIRASGDLVRPVRFAVMDLFNTLGPARSTWSVTTWQDTLRLAKVYAAATDVTGVDDANITTPSGNVAPPADTFGSSVSFLVPGKIMVWKP
jgi:uncharacterized phage protein gp47/JayE